MRWLYAVALFAAPACVHAQMSMNMGSASSSFTDNLLRHNGSGTDLIPASSVPPMLMRMRGNWMEMLHGEVTVAEQQQTGPRGHDKLFSVNWAMPMAQRSFAHGELTLRSMFSLEPATVSGRSYPELFQQGETAFGKPIIDGQHPHDLFMELAAIYDVKAGSHSILSLYAAPVGDPALGPEAFPHRASIGANPLAPLGHHLEDSTHIAYEVLTGGVGVGAGERGLRVEASGFHGREPGENRWTIYTGAIDSWSTRLSVAPHRDWAMQYSIGHLHSPEALHPEEDVLRQTASIAWHRSFGENALDMLAIWGRNHTIGTPVNANGYLVEGALSLHQQQTIWMRIENVDRTTDLLGAEAPPEERVVGRVQAYTGGYAHRIWSNTWSAAELGAQGTAYGVPATLTGLYGEHPFGVAAVLHWQIGH